MKSMKQRVAVLLLAVCVFAPATALAHQPRITSSTNVLVDEPEISKAYYGELAGEPHVYTIDSAEPFELYVNVLVPDIDGQKKDISAVVFKGGVEVTVLDGVDFAWEQFFEPFGHDTYWMGPEFTARVDAGEYAIRVSSTDNDSRYALAIGQVEAFDEKEVMNALTLIPKLKRNFFNTSPADFIFSPFGWGLIVAAYLLAVIFGFVYRAVLRRVSRTRVRQAKKNIGKADRLTRAAIGAGLLVLAITTTWNPIILFLSGFAFFEAAFSWCGVYAALGKNTCPM